MTKHSKLLMTIWLIGVLQPPVVIAHIKCPLKALGTTNEGCPHVHSNAGPTFSGGGAKPSETKPTYTPPRPSFSYPSRPPSTSYPPVVSPSLPIIAPPPLPKPPSIDYGEFDRIKKAAEEKRLRMQRDFEERQDAHRIQRNQAIGAINNSVMRNVDTINQGAEYEYNRAAARSQELGQQLQDYTREHPVDNEGLESAFEAAAAAKNSNLSNSVKQFGIHAKKTINDVESSEPAKELKNFGTRASTENIEKGISNTIDSLESSEVGRSIHEVGSKASGSIKKGIKNPGDDYWNPQKQINAVGGGLAAKVKPSIEKIGEGIGNIDKAREKALKDLRKFDPEEIFGWVQQSIKEDIADELKRNGLAFNQETGELDLRDTRMGLTLLDWLEKFVQGNNSEGKVEEFIYNVVSRKLTVHLYARHRQSSNKVIPGQKVDLYSVTQRAKFWYDFQSLSGDFEIDPGQLSPRFSSQTFEKLSEGDLTAVAELSPTAIGKVVNFERENEYEKNLNELRTSYGAENVYLASQDFVDWATPETLAKYAVNGVLTAGASVYPQIMADARKRAASEMPSITKWLEERGMENASAVAMDLLTGNPPKWPFLKFEMIPVRYSAREKPLNAMTTEWRHVNHLAFVITWINGVGK